MLKHDNKLNNSSGCGGAPELKHNPHNQKNAMVHTEAVQEALSAAYAVK